MNLLISYADAAGLLTQQTGTWPDQTTTTGANVVPDQFKLTGSGSGSETSFTGTLGGGLPYGINPNDVINAAIIAGDVIKNLPPAPPQPPVYVQPPVAPPVYVQPPVVTPPPSGIYNMGDIKIEPINGKPPATFLGMLFGEL